MDLESLIFDKPWMTEEERIVAEAFWQAVGEALETHGVEKNLLTLLRVNDVLVMYLLARRAEEALCGAGPGVKNDKPGAKRGPDASAFDGCGRAYERLRKAMKELEEACARAGKPIDAGIADVMKPILKKAEGVLQDALEFEARKQRKIESGKSGKVRKTRRRKAGAA